MKVVAFSCLLLVTLAFSSALVSAGRGDEDSRYRDVEEIELGSNLKLRSTLRNGTMKNRIDYEIHTDSDKVEFKVEYRTKTQDTNTEVKFEVRISKMFEFVESGATPGYQPTQDTRVGFINFDNWDDFVLEGVNGNVSTFSATTQDQRAKLVIMVAPEPFNVSYAGLPLIVFPNTVKFELTLNLTGYSYNSSTASRLGFAVRLDSKGKSKEEKNSQGFALQDSSKTRDAYEIGNTDDPKAVLGVFNWISVVVVDGASSNFIISPLNSGCDDGSNEGNCDQAFWTINAAAPRVVNWDPNIGVGTQYVDANTGINNPPTSNALAVSMNVALLVLLIALTYLCM